MFSLSARALLLVAACHAPAGPSAPSFTVDGNTVRIGAQAQSPVRFDVTPAKSDLPFPSAPVPGRVTVVESRMAPNFAPLEGRIERIAVSLGDRVTVGQHLVLVRSGELTGMIRELQAQKLAVATKRSIVERQRKLVEARAGAENDLIVATHELEEAELDARSADAKLRSLDVTEEGVNLYWMLARRGGTIVQLDAVPGQEVGPAKEKAVVTVADLSEVWVVADVPQPDAVSIKVKSVARVSVPGNQEPLQGEVLTVSEVVDPDRQTVPVRVRLDNADRKLRPHAFVEVVFDAPVSAPIIRVPSHAVVSDGSRSFVFVQSQQGIFERRQIVTGREQGGMAEIHSGVKEGEPVVTRGALLLLNALDVAQ